MQMRSVGFKSLINKLNDYNMLESRNLTLQVILREQQSTSSCKVVFVGSIKYFCDMKLVTFYETQHRNESPSGVAVHGLLCLEPNFLWFL